MAKRTMFLVNPNAGKGGYKATLGSVLETLCSGGIEPTVFFTERAGQAPEIVRERASDFELLICLGGDGTLSEVAAGLMHLQQRPPIGYIPLGTANDVARTLGLSAKPLEAARQILQGKPVPYDIGAFGPDDYFTYVAAFGAFTEVSYETTQEAKQALGHMAYMLEGIRQLPRINNYHAIVEYDGGVIEDEFIFGAVTNSTSVAGLVRLDEDRVGLADGEFEVLLVKKPLDILDVSDIVGSILSADFSGECVSFFPSREVRILFDQDVAWTRDGEDGGHHRDVYIANCHPGVEIFAG